METALQIIKLFKFMVDNKKSNKIVLQTSISILLDGSKPSSIIPKKLCKNQECINKSLSTHYTNGY